MQSISINLYFRRLVSRHDPIDINTDALTATCLRHKRPTFSLYRLFIRDTKREHSPAPSCWHPRRHCSPATARCCSCRPSPRLKAPALAGDSPRMAMTALEAASRAARQNSGNYSQWTSLSQKSGEIAWIRVGVTYLNICRFSWTIGEGICVCVNE